MFIEKRDIKQVFKGMGFSEIWVKEKVWGATDDLREGERQGSNTPF